jgi:hypothetical protein
MSADIRRLFPEGLKASECERGKPRHDPPLSFVPPPLPATEEGEEDYTKTITVELTDKTYHKIIPHSYRNIEDFLAYQKMHDYIMSQQNAKANWDSLELLLPAAELQRDAISANTLDPAEKKTRKKFKDMCVSLKKRQDSIVTKAFTLYQQMSGPALRAEWNDIVSEHCFSSGWPLPDGTVSTYERGQSWTTLAVCKRLHLLTVCDVDAAERSINYVNVTVKKAPRLNIKYFYKRIKELDDLTPSLPCLKDQPDCPAGVERSNVSMTPFAMCNLLMRNVTPKMEDEYFCLHDTVPTDPKKLVEQLTRIETKLRTISNEHKSNDHRKGGPPDDAHRRSRGGKSRPNAKGSGRAEQEKIPRKDLARPSNDHCKLCKEYGGMAKSHTTAQCKKWVPGGKSHNEWRGAKPANINVHQDVGVNQLMAQQTEFNKKIMKQMKSLEKKKKKSKRRRYSDSESSESE